MEENTWCPIRGYEGLYEINIRGEVKSIPRKVFHLNNVITIKEKILKQRIDRGGYFTVVLNKGGKSSTKYVHRLLLVAFLPNPQNKPFVNHINGNKLDNTFKNLEWVTHSENMKHALKMGLCKVPDVTKRKLYDKCNSRTFDSIKQAANYLGINHSTLRNRLRRRSKKCGCLNYLNQEKGAS